MTGFATASASGTTIDFEIEDIVPFGVETGEPVKFSGMFHPVGSDLTMAEAKRSTNQRVRHRVRGKDRAVEVGLLVDRLRAMTNNLSAASAADGGLRPAFAASRAQLGLVVVLLTLAGAGWWWTAGQMRGMDDGPWTGLGTFGWFLGIWVVMMAAMMFPSVAPTVALYSRMSTKSRLKPLVFTAGYLLTWAGAGVVAFVIGTAASHAAGGVLAWEDAGRPIAGATLIMAAVYELTPLKNVCLGKCRSPLGTLLGSWRDGWSGRASHGSEERCVVRRVLLGTDGVTLRVGRHECDLDGGRRGAHRSREDPSLAPDSDLRHGARPPGTGRLMLFAPDALPGLTVPGDSAPWPHDGVRTRPLSRPG